MVKVKYACVHGVTWWALGSGKASEKKRGNTGINLNSTGCMARQHERHGRHQQAGCHVAMTLFLWQASQHFPNSHPL